MLLCFLIHVDELQQKMISSMEHQGFQQHENSEDIDVNQLTWGHE
jgi:hypothetical protein